MVIESSLLDVDVGLEGISELWKRDRGQKLSRRSAEEPTNPLEFLLERFLIEKEKSRVSSANSTLLSRRCRSCELTLAKPTLYPWSMRPRIQFWASATTKIKQGTRGTRSATTSKSPSSCIFLKKERRILRLTTPEHDESETSVPAGVKESQLFPC